MGHLSWTSTPCRLHVGRKEKTFQSWRPIISFVDSPFRPMLNILARMIFQLIAVACPNHFASGDVYTLLNIIRGAWRCRLDPYLDLAGFFTSIDQERFIGAWFMLLDFLRPHMNVARTTKFSLSTQRKLILQEVPSKVVPSAERHSENRH